MYDDRDTRQRFYRAPESVAATVAAFLEPVVIVAVFLAATLWVDGVILRSDLVLCLLVFALTFPGRNRFREHPVAAATDIVTSWIWLLAILALCGYATRSLDFFDTRVLVAWAVLTPLAQGLALWFGRWQMQRLGARPQAQRTAVIVGADALGVKVHGALTGGAESQAIVVGYFDDRSDDRIADAAAAWHLGRLTDVAAFVREHAVKEVYITLPIGSQPRIITLLASLQGTTASVFFVPDVFGISIIQGRLQDMNGVPVVGLCETPFTGTNALIKRLSDIVLSALILVLIAPLLAAIAIGVKLSSPGPAIFKQRRNGLDGEEITVYKFRTMRVQEDREITQATKDDPRTTAFGAFLRRSSLDELPQFVNVLQGRMSIVGPRPHAVAHNEEYRKLIQSYMVRHKVKPGITGWAQIHGLRGETDTLEKMQTRVEYDLAYLRNWSLGLDLQIIVRTIRVVFADRNAY